MQKTIFITIMILYSISFSSSYYQIELLNSIPNNARDRINNADQLNVKNPYSFNDRKFYFHQLLGKQVVSLYSTPVITSTFKEIVKKVTWSG